MSDLCRRGHEAKYWAQTGLTPYGLTLDPEHAPGVLNWLGVDYYTPDSPHLPASAAAPVVLPTVKEVREAIIAAERDGGWIEHTVARAVLDLIASRVRHWVPVEPGTVIKAGTRLREDWDDQITEWTLGEDQDPYQNRGRQHRYYIDPATVPAEPEDQRIKRAHAIIPALQRVKNVPLGGDLLPAALEAIDAIDALEAQVQRVRELVDDQRETKHDHPMTEGHPECPACCVDSLDRALGGEMR